RILPTTCRDTPIFIRMVPGLPAEATAMAGGPLALALGGRRSPWANGCGIPDSVGPSLATNPGAGLLTTMAVGFLTLLAADGFIRRQSTTDMAEVMGVTREGAYLRSSIRLIRSTEQAPLSSFAKMASSVS